MSNKTKDALALLTEAGSYWVVNWKLVQFINDPSNGLKEKSKGSEGLEESIILGYLASMQQYWNKRGLLTSDGYFYCTVESMKEQTTLEARKQRKAIRTLIKMGLIDMKPIREKGVESKRYFKINTDVLSKALGIEDT